jgi:hypothetical protein
LGFSIVRSVARLLLIGGLIVTACSSPPAQLPYVEIASATIAASDPLPAPSGKVAMAVGGAVSKINEGGAIELDLATIEQMGLVRYVVHDPWLNEDLEFTGVLLSAFIDAVGASPNATTLKFRAIDDYEVEIAIADIRRWPIMLATRTNGQLMTLEDKGPTRVVFPYDQFPEIDQLVYKDLWIWQISSITVS